MALSLFASLCHYGADRLPWSVGVVFVVYLLAMTGMTVVTRDLGPIPDLLFGFSFEEIQQLFYETWDDAQRHAYIRATWIDLLVYMEAYTVALGMLLYQAAATRRMGVGPERLCAVCLPTMLCDVVETTLLQQACRMGHTTPLLVAIASWANQIKWTSFLGCGLVLLYALVLAPTATTKDKRT